MHYSIRSSTWKEQKECDTDWTSIFLSFNLDSLSPSSSDKYKRIGCRDRQAFVPKHKSSTDDMISKSWIHCFARGFNGIALWVAASVYDIPLHVAT